MSLSLPISGNVPLYRFYISTEPSSLSVEVFPLNFNSTSLIDEQEQDRIFYRRKFNGVLLFGTNSLVEDEDGNILNRRDDWTYFWAIEQATPCLELYLTIIKYLAGDITVYWEGIFSTTDGVFDIDRCTFEVTPKINDDYNSILDLADTQINILDAATTVSTKAYIEGVIDETYTNNRWLAKIGSNSVLELLADNVLTGVTVSSEFFTDSPNNYVTENPNKLLHLTIAQKSDIRNPTASNKAKTAMLSWNELMEILWAMFQVTWDYDVDTDTINVEHVSWWPAADGLDLRTQLLTQSTNKYSYVKEKMPKYEKFAFMEADDPNFVGVPIWYDSGCVDIDPKTNVKNTSINVTTDLEYIVTNNDAITDEGFVILCNYLNVTYFVELQTGFYVASVKLNNTLSWANLHECYYRHNRVIITGYINESLITFWTAQKTKLQECSAIICDINDYDPSEEITTELGEVYLTSAKASVLRSSISPMGAVKFSLLYGPIDNENTGVDDAFKYVRIDQDGDLLQATLTVIADMDIVVTIVNTDCSNNPNADLIWTIPTGSYYDTQTIIHRKIVSITTVSGDWEIDFNYDLNYVCA